MAKSNSDNLRFKRRYLVWRKEARGLSDASVDKSAAAISTYETFLDGKDFAVSIRSAPGVSNPVSLLSRICAPAPNCPRR